MLLWSCNRLIRKVVIVQGDFNNTEPFPVISCEIGKDGEVLCRMAYEEFRHDECRSRQSRLIFLQKADKPGERTSWGTGIRTPTKWFRAIRATFTPFPKCSIIVLCYGRLSSDWALFSATEIMEKYRMKRRNFVKGTVRWLLLGGLVFGVGGKTGGMRPEPRGLHQVSCRNCPMILKTGDMMPEACLKSKASCLMLETKE